ncbi:MAG: DUF4038 domain-containing protein [Armatimonadetes bacterium]|nr:DUF4038 domain-containing protein [Armatimonadota bacterium]
MPKVSPEIALCVLLLFALTCSAGAADGGLTVRDGQLLRDGKPFRAFGLNVRDLADDILDKGDAATDSFACLKWLGEQKVPFIRFWASYFSDRQKYLADPETYWRHMDLLVDAAEQAGVGLAPTLFWDSWNVPWGFGEHCRDWGDETSRTREFMERYVSEFVTRYRGRQAVWFYEFSNENNLMWDLPNTMEFLPENQRVEANIARWQVGRESIAAFGRAVRALDPERPISSGCSEPRACQWHLANTPATPWQADTLEQFTEAAGWTAPDPVDLLCVHNYQPFGKYGSATARTEIGRDAGIAEKLHRALYIGEFGVLDGDGKLEPGFDAKLYEQRARDVFEVIYQNKVPLAAWWVYAPKPWGYGMGAVNPAYGKFDFVVGLVREYNERIAKDLQAARPAPSPAGRGRG